jgi:hypothetical protein
VWQACLLSFASMQVYLTVVREARCLIPLLCVEQCWQKAQVTYGRIACFLSVNQKMKNMLFVGGTLVKDMLFSFGHEQILNQTALKR